MVPEQGCSMHHTEVRLQAVAPVPCNVFHRLSDGAERNPEWEILL